MRSNLGRFHRPMSRGLVNNMLTMNNLGDGSTLSLDFTAMGGVLDPRLTFSRASTATFVNSSGYVEYAGANLLLQSETISTSPWTDQNGATRLQVSITNPIGGATSTQVTSGTASNAITQSPTYQAGLPHVIRIWVRAGTSSQLQLGVFAGGFVTGTISVISGTATVSGTGLFLVTGLTSTWTQLQIVYPSLTGSGAFLIYPDTASPVTGRTIYVWGAQLNPGSTAQTYYPTTTAAYHAPRFDYSPTNIGEPRGLLIEGQGINTLIYSQRILVGSGGWFYGGAGTQSTTPDYQTGPDGISLSASRLQLGFNCSLKQLGGTNGTNNTVSIWAKSNNGLNQNMAFWTGSSASNKVITTQWQRFEAVVNFATSTAFDFYKTDVGDCDILIWGAQLETGSGASSYIPTGASQVTRNGDSCVMTGTNFSSWFAGATEGVIFAQYQKQRSQSGNATHDYCAVGSRYNLGEGLILYNSNTNFYPTAILWPTGGAIFAAGIATAIPSVTKQAAKWFAANDITTYSNGVVGTTAAGTGTVTPAMLSFGANSNTGTEATRDWLNACVRRVKFYPTALSDAAIQTLTTP